MTKAGVAHAPEAARTATGDSGQRAPTRTPFSGGMSNRGVQSLLRHMGATRPDAPAHRPQIRVQPKLTVNSPGDTFEHDADRVAERVMRSPAPCACGGTCDKCGGGRT